MEDAPPGFNSVHGVRAEPGVASDFDDDEYVVYNRDQQRLDYLVEFDVDESDVRAVQQAPEPVGAAPAVAAASASSSRPAKKKKHRAPIAASSAFGLSSTTPHLSSNYNNNDNNSLSFGASNNTFSSQFRNNNNNYNNNYNNNNHKNNNGGDPNYAPAIAALSSEDKRIKSEEDTYRGLFATSRSDYRLNDAHVHLIDV